MAKSRKVTTFKLEDVFLRGPSALPRELRHRPPMHNPLVVEKSPDTNNTHEIDSIDSNSIWVDFFESTVNFFYEPFESLSEDLSPIENEFEKEEFYQSLLDQYEDKNELMASIALPSLIHLFF
jgi:hypothetical protein